jgi:hypothetical protein
VNPLLQQADIVSAEEAKKIMAHDYSLPALAEKKYVLPIEVRIQTVSTKIFRIC